MNELASSVSDRWLLRAARVVLALSTVVVVVGSLLPSVAVGRFRSLAPWFARVWDWLDASLPGWNPMHVILYAWLAFGWWLLAPRRWRAHGVVALVALSVLTEVLQTFAPGREPRLSDVGNDLLGLAIGIGLGAIARRWWRRRA